MGLVVKSSADDLDGTAKKYLSGGLESLGDSCTIEALFSFNHLWLRSDKNPRSYCCCAPHLGQNAPSRGIGDPQLMQNLSPCDGGGVIIGASSEGAYSSYQSIFVWGTGAANDGQGR